MNFFTKLFRSRDKPMNHLGGLSFLFGQTAAGKAVNERTAMQTTAVYACVRILAASRLRLQGTGQGACAGASAVLPAPRCSESRNDEFCLS